MHFIPEQSESFSLFQRASHKYTQMHLLLNIAKHNILENIFQELSQLDLCITSVQLHNFRWTSGIFNKHFAMIPTHPNPLHILYTNLCYMMRSDLTVLASVTLFFLENLLMFSQGCTNRCSLAAGLRGNEERMRK